MAERGGAWSHPAMHALRHGAPVDAESVCACVMELEERAPWLLSRVSFLAGEGRPLGAARLAACCARALPRDLRPPFRLAHVTLACSQWGAGRDEEVLGELVEVEVLAAVEAVCHLQEDGRHGDAHRVASVFLQRQLHSGDMEHT
ncbi:uncharacterized protein LOC144955705, partial [Lampetra fluviatilis]